MTNTRAIVPTLFCLLIACGTNTAPSGEGSCPFEEDSFLPYQDGYRWQYRVVDLSSGSVSSKEQRLTRDGDEIVQTTLKTDGITESRLQMDGSTIRRLVQEDQTLSGDRMRLTVYEPSQLRIDESRIDVGVRWEDTYTALIEEIDGTQLEEQRVDQWEVLDLDVPCESPLGTFRCIHLSKTRIVGGTSEKEYFFARGIGKVLETNANQLEELVGCSDSN